jgi:hypothetical protein
MSCPSAKDWDLLAMELLEDEQAERLLAHAKGCAACREQFQNARRAHTDRVRMYEAFDRDHDEQREQLMAALPDEAPGPVRDGWVSRSWRRLGGLAVSVNKSAGRRAAAMLLPAACILIAVVVLLAPGQKSAFAAALEHFKAAQTIVCRVTMPGLEFYGMTLEGEGKLWLSETYGSCSEMFVNGLLVTRHYASPTGPMVLLQPMTRTYMELDVSEIAHLELNEQSPDAFLRKLAELAADDATELRKDTVDGHEALGYLIPGQKLGFAPSRGAQPEEAYAELWVNAESQLPVRFLVSVPISGHESPLVVAYDRFEWDVPLDASRFEPDIPDGYTKVDVSLMRPTEETLLNALQRIRGLSGGRYPTKLDSVSVLAELHGLLNEQGVHKLDELGYEGVVQLGMEVASGAKYYMQLVREGHEPEYFGDTVTADDADEVLLQWKLDDGRMRVIYGDLRIETVPVTD